MPGGSGLPAGEDEEHAHSHGWFPTICDTARAECASANEPAALLFRLQGKLAQSRGRSMELAALGSESVLRDADVVTSREKARQARLRRLLLVLVVIGVPVIGRTAAGVVRYLQGNYMAAAGDFHWPHPGIPSSFLPYLPGLILIVLLGAVMAGPLLMAGRSPHVLYRPEEIGVTLADVVGAGAVVEEVVKTLNLFLAHRTFEERMGGTPRRAVLFEGPPGTGKTYVAKAMAAEAGVPFLFVSSSAFQSMYYGQTSRKIRSYFRALRNYARREGGAIGFIEEIDAIGAARGGLGAGPGREGIAGVVNELLIQLQSFDVPPFGTRAVNAVIDVANRWLPPAHVLRKRVVKPANFLVVGATNRATDLDPALLRPGRFDKTIRVDVPSRAGRREVIDYYLARKAHEAELDDAAKRDALAGATFGYSPVMLEHLLDEALVWALRAGRSSMSWADVQRARMTEELGMAQAVTYTDSERRAIATHEAGHATVAYFGAPERHLDVLSIIKRSEALGLLAHSDREERFTRTRSECEALLRIAMGGMVAEEIFLGEASTGPSGDLAGATRLAAQMVGSYGMAGSLISLEASNAPADIVSKALSDEACRKSVETLLESARSAAREVLASHQHVVVALRDALLERDELVGDDITAVIVAARRGSTAVAGDPPVPAAVPGPVVDIRS
jgi:cell division protease FtsH